MPEVIELQLYVTRVVGGVVQADSQLVTIRITDADGDGIIDTKEWTDATGSVPGFLRGTEAEAPQPALWVGTRNGNLTDGKLYTDTSYTTGTNVQPLLRTLVQNKFEVSFDDLMVCFLAGTLIATPDGERAVESLRPGDVVLTRDHGPQPLVWTGSSAIDAARLDLNPNRRPIRIAAGAVGDGLPRRDLFVSAQHRILIRDAEGREYLAAALHLLRAGMPGFSVQRDDLSFDLVHVACGNHEIILAEGAATESFFTGPMALRALTGAQKAELIAAFPALSSGENPMTPARPFLKRKQAAALVDALQGAAV